MQISRLFEIVYILLNKKTVTAKELAEHFEVSQRTIYRDIDTLNLAGIPVYTNKGKGGGISLLENFVLNKSILNENEQTEILSALKGLSVVKSTETDQILNKLSTLFNKNTVNWLEVDFSDWSYTNSHHFHLLKTAILDRVVTEFDYYSTYGEKTHRKIEPIQLWFKHRAWYIKGFCLEKQDVRLFKLTRIKNLIVTDNPFAARNLLSACYENEPPENRRKDVTLKLKIAPQMTYRIYDDFDEDQVAKHEDGSFTVTVTYPEDEWVYGFVLSFGEYIEVLEPERIRNVLREKLHKSLEKYT